MFNHIKYFGRILLYVYRRFFNDGCPHLAASLAYTTLLSFVPFLMVGYVVLATFPIFSGVAQTIQNFIIANFVATSAEVLTKEISNFTSHIAELTWFNVIGLGCVALLMIYNIMIAFNAIWRIKIQHQHIVISSLIYTIVLVLFPFLVGMLMLMSSYIATLPLISEVKGVLFIEKPIFIIFPYLAAFLLFTLSNWILPSCKVRFWHAVIAGFVTTILFELAKFGFSVYLSYIPVYRVIYGALAIIPVFLIWMYVSWSIILWGVVVCNTLSLGTRALNINKSEIRS